ncbi:MAG TPA: fimbria/pilus periplasmic chaperone [Thermoanaerobaculia bacterium]|jgi:P pilus assembly chaperone PapD
MKRTLALLALLFLAASIAAQPQKSGGVGDLLVAPTRVVLSERTRTAEIALINTGSSTTTYRIGFRHMRMNESGQLVEVDGPDGERFADPYLVYTPRQVTLEPRVAQTVRIRLRLPEGAEEGEYRTHLEFRGLPPADMSEAKPDDGEVAIRVVPIYAVSIPLLVRRGSTEAELAIEDLAVRTEGEGMQATFHLRRSGNRSTYGNVVARFVPNGGGEEQVVGAVNGISIYLPLAERRVTLPLRAPLRDGVLRVTYVDADGAAGTAPLEAHLVLP